MQNNPPDRYLTGVQHIPPELLSLVFSHLPVDQRLLPALVAQKWYIVCRRTTPPRTLFLRGSTYIEFGERVARSDITFKSAVVALDCLGFCTDQQSALVMLLPHVERGLRHLPNVKHLHLRYCLALEGLEEETSTAKIPPALGWTGPAQMTSMMLTTVTFEHLLHFVNLLSGTVCLRHLAVTDVWWPEHLCPASAIDIFKNNRPPRLASLNVAISYPHVHEDLAAWFGSIPIGASSSLAIQYSTSNPPPLPAHQLAGFHPESLRFLALQFKGTYFTPHGLSLLDSLEVISFAHDRTKFTNVRGLRHAQTLVASVRSNTAWCAIINIDIVPHTAHFDTAQFIQELTNTPGLHHVYYIAPSLTTHVHAIFKAVSNLALFSSMTREEYTKLLAERGITPHSAEPMPDPDLFFCSKPRSQ